MIKSNHSLMKRLLAVTLAIATSISVSLVAFSEETAPSLENVKTGDAANPTQEELLAQYYAALAKMQANDKAKSKEPTQEEQLAQYYAALAKMQEAGKAPSNAVDPKAIQASREIEVYNIIMSFAAKYPEGMSWGLNSHVYQWSRKIYRPFGLIGYDCVAFAMELSDAAFGKTPITEYYDVNMIRVGDVIRINGDTHSVVVTQILADGSYVLAEANYGGKVHWGRTFSYAEMCNRFDYGWTRY